MCVRVCVKGRGWKIRKDKHKESNRKSKIGLCPWAANFNNKKKEVKVCECKHMRKRKIGRRIGKVSLWKRMREEIEKRQLNIINKLRGPCMRVWFTW